MTEDIRALKIPDSWSPVVDAYLQHCASLGRRPETIMTYRQRLAHIARAVDCRPSSLTSIQLEIYLSGQVWAKETRRARTHTIKSFWEWMVKTSRAESNITEGIEHGRPGKPNPRPVPYDIYLASLARAAPRTQLILRLAGEHGLRRGEIALLHTTDLDPGESGTNIQIKGKGGNDRVIPVSRGIAEMVRALPEGWLFPGSIDGHLSPRRVSELAKTVLPNPWTIHKLRHMFASLSYELTRDLLAVQAILGHASPATTKAYIAIKETKLRNAVDAVSGHHLSRSRQKQTHLINFELLTTDEALALISTLSGFLQKRANAFS